jgi:hypothetical protein
MIVGNTKITFAHSFGQVWQQNFKRMKNGNPINQSPSKNH